MEKSNYNFEELLSKNTSEVSHFLNCDFELKILTKNFQDISLKKETYYYSFQIKLLSLTIDYNDIISSISIPFKSVFSLEFFNLFIENYGVPDSIFVKTGEKIIGKSEEKDESKSFKQKLTQTIFEIKEGELEYKPSFIFWKKENYTIKISMYYNENVCSITFNRM